jgi:hypothetical protein
MGQSGEILVSTAIGPSRSIQLITYAVSSSSLKLSQGARNIRLEGATLHADVLVVPAGISAPADMKWEPASFPLDSVFGNVNGVLQFGFKYFSRSAENIKLNGTILTAKLKNEKGEWVESSIDIDNKFYVGVIGKPVIIAQQVPVLVAIPKVSVHLNLQSAAHHNSSWLSLHPISTLLIGVCNVQVAEGALLQQLGEKLESNPNLTLAALDHGDGTTTFVVTEQSNSANIFKGFTNHPDDNPDAKIGYYRVGIDIDGADTDAVFKTMDASAKAAVFHVASNKGHPVKQFSADVLQAKASATLGGVAGGSDGTPIYAGVDAQVNLVDLKASVFDLNLGVGVKTDIGVKDYSVGGHVLGCGFTVGKKTSISAWGSTIGIDFGRFIG